MRHILVQYHLAGQSLSRVLLDGLSGLVDLGAQLLASVVLFFQELSILLHGFILAVALPEHVKRLRAICQDLE